MSSVFEEDLCLRQSCSLSPGLHEDSNIAHNSQHNKDIEKWKIKYYRKESELKLSEGRLIHLTNFIAKHQSQLPDNNTLSQRFANLKKGINKSDSSDSGIGGQSMMSSVSTPGCDHTNSFIATSGENFNSEDSTPVDVVQVGVSKQYFDNVMAELFKTKLHLTKLLNKAGTDVHVLKESIQLKEMVKGLQKEIEILKGQREQLKMFLFAQVDGDIAKYHKEAIYLVQKVDQLMRDAVSKDNMIESTNNSNEKLKMAMKELKKRNQQLLRPTDPEADPCCDDLIELTTQKMREMSCQTDEGKITAKEMDILKTTLDESIQERQALKMQCEASDKNYAELLQNMESHKADEVTLLEKKLREENSKIFRLKEDFDRRIREVEESKKQQHSNDKRRIDLLEREVEQMQTMKNEFEMLLESQSKQADATACLKPAARNIDHLLEPYAESSQTFFKQSMSLVQVDGSMPTVPTPKSSSSQGGAIPKSYTCERCQQTFKERQRFQDHREKCED